MAKQWLAVIRDNELLVARISVKRNKDMKIHFLAQYPGQFPISLEAEDGEINYELRELKHWFQSLNIPLKKIKIAVSSLGLITRVISLPEMPKFDLENLMTNHIDQYFTVDVSKYLIDYRIIDKYQDNEKTMMNVLLAAFPIERMDYVLKLCRRLGSEPAIVDLGADCVARIYGYLIRERFKNTANVSEGASVGDMAIVSLHSEKAEFVLLRNGQFFIYSETEMDIEGLSYKTDFSGLVFESDEEGKELLDSEYDNRTDQEKDILSTYLIHKEDEDKGTESIESNEFVDIEINKKEERKRGLQAEIRFLDDQVELHQASDDDLFDLMVEIPSQDIFGQTSWEIGDIKEDPSIKTADWDKFADTIEVRVQDLDVGQGPGSEFGDLELSDPEEPNNRQELDTEGKEETYLETVVGLPELDFSIKPDEEKVQYKQSALNMDKDEPEEEEFILEDLFVPIENLDDEQWKTSLASEPPEPELTEGVNGFQYLLKTRKENIFDTLDLDKTLIGVEELEVDSDMDPIEQLETRFSQVLSTLTELLSFFAARNFGHTVNTVYLTGEYCTLPHLVKVFEDNLGIETIAGLPNGWRPQFAKGVKPSEQDWHKYACLYGLALRED